LAKDVAEAGRVVDAAHFIRMHLMRLAVIVGISLLLGSMTLTLEIRLSFVWAVLVAIAALLLLRRLLQSLR